MTSHAMALDPAQAADMVAQVADTLLGCPLSNYAAMRRGAWSTDAPCDAYALELTLAQNRVAVVMVCGHKDALALAARMLDKQESELSDKLVKDAASEWLNILAGQFKSLAGLDHAMGLPQAIDGDSEQIRHAEGLKVTFGGCNVTMWLGLITTSNGP